VPKPVSREKALRDKLREAADHAIFLNSQLELVVSVKPRQPSGVFHGKIDFAQPPWHAPVANCIMDLHAESRRLENTVQRAVNLPERKRGGSSGNTVKAIQALCGLCVTADEFTVRMATAALGAWSRRASIVLSLTEAPKRMPRNPGEPEPACPWCKHHTLRLFPLDEKVCCIDSECVDEEGRRPRAAMRYSPIVGDFILIWQNDVAA